jgi:hypothetical protein
MHDAQELTMRPIGLENDSTENMDRLLSHLAQDSLAWKLLTALRQVSPADWTKVAGDVLQREVTREIDSYGDGAHQ